VRSLSGFLNNCGIVTRPHANRIAEAFELYKSPSKPRSRKSVSYRRAYARGTRGPVRFIGVWDTVGSLGVPLSFAGFLNDKHLFHDNKIGGNVRCARHALAIDEMREDFEPTIWKSRPGLDLGQLWFCGVHTDVGGGYVRPGRAALSDIPLAWMIREARAAGLSLEPHLDKQSKPVATAKLHDSYKGFMKLLGKSRRRISRIGRDGLGIHTSVKERWTKNADYRPPYLRKHVKKYGWRGIQQ
jgi:uncharacterized protein (DUF2235 family)